MDLLHNVVLLRCPDSDKQFTPVSLTTVELSASDMYSSHLQCKRVNIEAVIAICDRTCSPSKRRCLHA